MDAQEFDLFPSDINVGRWNQNLLEEFLALHGTPNDAEMEVLQRAGMTIGTINEWCK